MKSVFNYAVTGKCARTGDEITILLEPMYAKQLFAALKVVFEDGRPFVVKEEKDLFPGLPVKPGPITIDDLPQIDKQEKEMEDTKQKFLRDWDKYRKENPIPKWPTLDPFLAPPYYKSFPEITLDHQSSSPVFGHPAPVSSWTILSNNKSND